MRAIAELNGILLLGREIKVNSAMRKQEGEEGPAAPRVSQQFGKGSSAASYSVFVGNVAWDVSQELLENMMDDILGPGQFTKVRVATERDTGRPRGFAHVDFRSEEAMRRAVQELNGVNLLGRTIRVDFAQGPANGRAQ